jgi:hypothetical protein
MDPLSVETNANQETTLVESDGVDAYFGRNLQDLQIC